MDIYFLLLVAFIFASYAQIKLQSTYSKTSKIMSNPPMTGQQMARHMLDTHGLNHVQVLQVKGYLSDHYNPRNKTVNLSPDVYNSSSVAAVGIAAHECGHAIQDAQKYPWLKLRAAIIPITNIGSQLAVPLIFIGFLFDIYELQLIGVIGYSLMTVFQLITLPVEFNASNRALKVIEDEKILVDSEYKAAKSTLTAAALTYVAALLSSLTQLLYLISRTKGSKRNRK